MRRLAFFAPVFAASLFAQAPAIAQNIELSPGDMRILVTHERFENILVGKETIADVVPLTDRRFAVKGIEPGHTTLLAMNKGELVATFEVTVIIAELNGRQAVTVHKNGKPATAYACDQDDEGVCTFYQELRVPLPVINTGPVITADAIRAAQGR